MGTIITIGGDPGSGKSTLGRMLATRLDIPFFSMGMIRREYATQHGWSLEELNRRAKDDPTSDRLVDEYQQELPRKHDAFVIDSRLGFHFIPASIKIYVRVDARSAAERIFAQRRVEEEWDTIDDGIASLLTRKEADRQRYIALYDVDQADLAQYDIVVESTGRNPLDVMDDVVDRLRAYGVRVPK
jgi:cytidylate kinase